MAVHVDSGSQHQPMSEINVTPFVDVMLVLLVIFMVTAPLIYQQVNIELPETSSRKAVAVTEKDLVIQIDKEKTISLAKNEMTLRELGPKLKEIHRVKKNQEVFLQADKRIPYGFVIQVMATVKNAGIERLGMITDPEPPK